MDSRGVPLERSPRPSPVAIVALLTGLLVTAALAVTTLVIYNRNEDRLLDLRAKELGLVLASAIQPIQTQLATTAELARATHGDPARFRTLMEPDVGTGKQFISASEWPLGVPHPRPLAVVGSAPRLADARAEALFARVARRRELGVEGLLQLPQPGVGYAYTASRNGRGFVIYTESALQKDRRSKLEGNSAFSDLDYALYLGRAVNSEALLVTSLAKLPITGRRASDRVPFGDRTLTIVITPRGSLGGTFFRILPWLVAIIGLLLSVAAAMITERLFTGRQRAEQMAGALDRLAAETEQMYTEQRGIAQTLQHALLPDTLPEVGGLEVSARYVAASSGVEVGGDWYDLVATDQRHALLVIGDVSGHGLRAATTMASLRHATLAYAANDPHPAVVLERLSRYVNSSPHDYFATVLCVLIDVDGHSLSVASAGHLPPLLLGDDGAGYVELTASAPIGVAGGPAFAEVSVPVPPHATLVAFTDGLVERRAEVIDVGLGRLRDAAVKPGMGLEELIATLPGQLASDGHHDDTAIVGIQWQD
jgi:serine phosphatase RsbU (regulator of sigma subunit)